MCTVTAVECRRKVINDFGDKECTLLQQLSVVERSLTISVTKNVYCYSSWVSYKDHSPFPWQGTCTTTAVECRTKAKNLFPDRECVLLQHVEFPTKIVHHFSDKEREQLRRVERPRKVINPNCFFFFFFLRRICTARLWQLSLAQRSLTLSPSRNVYGCQSNGLPRAVLRAD